MIMTVTADELIGKGIAARKLGASAEVVGDWIWARFPQKPSDETIAAMKALGYQYSKAKSRWYFVGAISTAVKRSSWSQICTRYAPVSIDEYQNQETAVAAA